MEKLKNILIHPLTGLSVVVSALGSIGFIPFDIWGLIVNTSGLWFPAIATTASTILPNIGYPTIGTQVLVASAIVYVAVQLYRFSGKAMSYIKDR